MEIYGKVGGGLPPPLFTDKFYSSRKLILRLRPNRLSKGRKKVSLRISPERSRRELAEKLIIRDFKLRSDR
jgi:hypothetical protein